LLYLVIRGILEVVMFEAGLNWRGAMLVCLVVRGTTALAPQVFANRFIFLSQQSYANPYMREAYNQQIQIEVYNAFSNTPPNRHEQKASDLMSVLASYPVHATSCVS
jgi:hypothetical protein